MPMIFFLINLFISIVQRMLFYGDCNELRHSCVNNEHAENTIKKRTAKVSSIRHYSYDIGKNTMYAYTICHYNMFLRRDLPRNLHRVEFLVQSIHSHCEMENWLDWSYSIIV